MAKMYVQGKEVDAKGSTKPTNKTEAERKTGKAVVVSDTAKAQAKVAERFEKHSDHYAADINASFDAAAKSDNKAQDHRLSAALKLAEVKNTMIAAGKKPSDFQAWVEKNVKQSWETVRKLAVIGASGDRDQAMKLLTATREKNKDANKKSRASKKAEKADAAPSLRDMLTSADASKALKAVRGFAKDNGFEVLSEAEVKQLRKPPVAAEPETAVVEVEATAESVLEAFNQLPAKAKMDVAREIALRVGAKLDLGDFSVPPKEDLLDIPPALRRQRKTAAPAAQA